MRVLQGEAENLSEVLKKAFPDDSRQVWTYEDLSQAVHKSRTAWESKERLGKGKPQRLFHSLMSKFDMHSGLFSIVPSGNLYASLLTGAATILVKASTNHSKTIEELSAALDSISDSIALCKIDRLLIRSQPVQAAVAKLYIAVFLFFGDAITWYKSSSSSKVLNSLHNNFSDRFQKAINVVHRQAAQVRDATNLGSQAELRVVRLDLEDLRAELQDMRIGYSGDLRRLAEGLWRQHGENMKQHELTQRLLREWTYLRKYESASHEQQITPKIESAPPRIPLATVRTLLAEIVQAQAEVGPCGPYPRALPHETLFDSRLTQRINPWLSNESSSIAYIEYQTSRQNDPTCLCAGAQIVRRCKEHGLAAVVHVQALKQLEPTTLVKDDHFSVIYMMVEMAANILQLLPDDEELLAADWHLLLSHSIQAPVQLPQASELLRSALRTRKSSLLLVVLGSPAFFHATLEAIESFLDVVRTAAKADKQTGVKMMILTQVKLHNVLPLLDPSEIAIVQATSFARGLKSPISIQRNE